MEFEKINKGAKADFPAVAGCTDGRAAIQILPTDAEGAAHPRCPVDDLEATLPQQSPQVSTPLLLIEPDAGLRALLREMICAEGYIVHEASDGKSGLHFLFSGRHEPPKLIVLDLGLAGMTGWEFLEIIRNYFRFSRIPVVSFSEQRMTPSELRQTTLAWHVQKPNVEQVVEIIRSILPQKEPP